MARATIVAPANPATTRRALIASLRAKTGRTAAETVQLLTALLAEVDAAATARGGSGKAAAGKPST